MISTSHMTEKYKNRYRIASHRMPHWDYSANGAYFITIVTQGRKCLLGDVINNEMVLSDFGRIVKREWDKSFEIRQELYLHEYVIMPNHLHAIVLLDNSHVSTCQRDHGVFQRLPKSISSFIAGFKSAVNSKIDDYIDHHHLGIPKYNRNNHFFQPNYHDHIIHNHASFVRIQQYIIDNPRRWSSDRFGQ